MAPSSIDDGTGCKGSMIFAGEFVEGLKSISDVKLVSAFNDNGEEVNAGKGVRDAEVVFDEVGEAAREGDVSALSGELKLPDLIRASRRALNFNAR